MAKYRIGNTSFGSLESKNNWILKGVLHSLKYIGKESKLSETENELRKLAIKDLKKIIKTKIK